MKPVTTTALVCVALFGAFTQVRAQDDQKTPPADHHQGGMPPEHYMDRLSQQLNLTPEQKTKVQGVFEQMQQQIRAAFETAKTNAETQLQTILTPQQFEQLQAMLQRHEQQFRHHGQGGDDQGEQGQGGTGNQGGGQKQGGAQNRR